MFRINNISVKNFKCIEDDKFDFNGDDLILFDGPNGYGKTSVFDAIEFCLTGDIRRISDNDNIDAKVAYNDSPIHHIEENPVSITIELINTNTKEIIRLNRGIKAASELTGQQRNPKNFFNNADDLKIESTSGSYNDIQEVISYPHINELYGVLNYVEQDENTFFIKQSAKHKYIGLSKLLGIDDTNQEIKKVKKFSDDLAKEIRNVAKNIDQITEENKESLKQKFDQIEYKILTKNRELDWDKEEMTISSLKQRDQFIEEIQTVEELIKHKGYLKQTIDFKVIKEFIQKENRLDEFIKFYWYTVNEGEAERLFRLSRIDTLLKGQLIKLQQGIEKKKYAVILELKDEELGEVLPEKSIREDLVVKSEMIRDLKKTLNEKSKVLESLKSQRDSLIDYYQKHKEQINHDSGSCPLCGHSWNDQQNLLQQIEATNKVLFESFNLSNKKLGDLKESVSKIFVENNVPDNINKKIDKIELINEERLTAEDYTEFESKQTDFKSRFKRLIESVNEEKRESIVNLLSQLSEYGLPVGYKNKEEIRNLLEESTPKFPEGYLPDESYSLFKKLFELDFEFLNSISENDVINKKNYIKYQYLNAINEELKKLEQKKEKLMTVDEKVQSILGILSEKIKHYIQGIISNITAPFYIYTSKILQHHALGTGLVFNAELEKSSPEIHITPLSKSQEASYSLSSGQLSATVVALMLVLNRVYNKSHFSTILIDDPIQTLDEINTHSLVELLKHNFINDQIIISTHEKRYSKFIRYKYEKFGLSHTNISMYDRAK